MPSAGHSPFPLNGINGTTGAYLSAPESVDALYAVITARPALTQVLADEHYANLNAREERATTEVFGLAAGIDHKKLEETGWGVIFPFDAPPELYAALRPLLDHRRAEAAKKKAEFYREFGGPQTRDVGYRPGDTKPGFLKRLGRAVGQPADPRRGIPYYLLLVGSPRVLPWRFQYDLDVEYAVGRIHFETDDGQPDYEAYHRYAQSVVLAETQPATLPRAAAFFAPNHDPATQYSADKLVRPLMQEMTDWEADKQLGWQFSQCLGADAKKARLAELVGGARTPTLLFTASHGVGFEKGDPRQLAHQGGLVCQDLGPVRGDGPVPEAAYFSAADLGADARVHGLLSFHFACFGAGTPEVNDFPDPDRVFRNQQVAPFPFTARLPQRLLAHPRGGALGFVGHVDRAWTCSFLLGRNQDQIDTFASLVKELLDGSPLGHALEYFNERYAALAAVLTSDLDRVRFGRIADEAFKERLASTWLEHSDARNYVIFGDPAVRLRTVEGAGTGHTDQAAALLPLAASPPGGALPFTPRAGGAGAPPAPPVPSEPTAMIQPVPFDVDQITAAEQRYDDLLGPAPFAFAPPTTIDLLRRNDRDRLVRRLRRLGMPADQAAAAADRLLGQGDEPAAFAIGVGAAAAKELGLERILGKNELLCARYLALGLAAAGAVGRVNVRGRVRGHGTGSLVSPRLLLTNNHVLKNADVAAASFVEFNYQEGLDGQDLPVIKVEFDPVALFVTDRTLDFTLVAIRPTAAVRTDLTGLGYLPMADGDDTFVVGENVTIIQHPNGERKQVALRDNQVIGESGKAYLHYRTSTMPGSSGSPVFNDEFELVGLHHSGVPRRDPQTRAILTKDGQPWQQGMGEDRIDWVANEGILIPAILTFLAAQPLTGRAKELLAELREAGRHRRPQTVAREVAGVGSGVVVGRTDRAVVASPGELVIRPEPGQTTLIIPAGVTVRVAVTSDTAVTSAPQPTTPLPARSPEKTRALAELEAASTRAYYDAAGDTAARTAYYQGLAPAGDRADFYRQLSRKLKDTHATTLGYQPATHLYPWVGLRPNRKIQSIYSGRQFDPAELIEADFAIEAERTAQLQELLARESAFTPDELAAELDLLEARLLYNCEHVVPQSWFNKKQPMKGDLHHLFACESDCNSFRGNTPYYDFPDFEEAVREECGKKEGNKFEPGAGKGPVARATLYFLLRYPGQINATANEYTAERLAILLRWHAAAGPDDFERHRNQAIFEKQGNRNPLIDFPEWAPAIDFTLGLG